MLKAVLFDMDGVIIDSEPMHTKAFMESMKEYGLDLSETYLEQFVGRTDRYLCELLVSQFHLTADPELLVSKKNEALKQLLLSSPYPAIPYVTTLIKNLYDHSIKLAIASSSPMNAIAKTAADLDVDSYFTKYVSGMDLTHSKPAPDIFLKAAQMLGVDPSECVVIEDSENGVKAAKAANMTCIGYYNPHSGKQDLSLADIIVEGFDEIDTAFVLNIYERSHGLPLTIAKTQDLILRELTIEDAKELYSILQNPEVNRYLRSQSGTYDEFIEQHTAYIETAYHFYGYGLWGIFLRSTNELIGQCGIQNKTVDEAVEYELGYLLRPEFQKKGYAHKMAQAAIQYGFESLELPRIIAVIAKENTASIKTALSLGMQYEKELMYDGHACNLYVINRT